MLVLGMRCPFRLPFIPYISKTNILNFGDGGKLSRGLVGTHVRGEMLTKFLWQSKKKGKREEKKGVAR
jgi:hypothetical protein